MRLKILSFILATSLELIKNVYTSQVSVGVDPEHGQQFVLIQIFLLPQRPYVE